MLFGDGREETETRGREDSPRDRPCRLILSRLVVMHLKEEKHKSRRRVLPCLLLHLRPGDHTTTTPSVLRRQTVLEVRPPQLTMHVGPPVGKDFQTHNLRAMVMVVTVMMETQWVRQPGRFPLRL